MEKKTDICKNCMRTVGQGNRKLYWCYLHHMEVKSTDSCLDFTQLGVIKSK